MQRDRAALDSQFNLHAKQFSLVLVLVGLFQHHSVDIDLVGETIEFVKLFGDGTGESLGRVDVSVDDLMGVAHELMLLLLLALYKIPRLARLRNCKPSLNQVIRSSCMRQSQEWDQKVKKGGHPDDLYCRCKKILQLLFWYRTDNFYSVAGCGDFAWIAALGSAGLRAEICSGRPRSGGVANFFDADSTWRVEIVSTGRILKIEPALRGVRKYCPVCGRAFFHILLN